MSRQARVVAEGVPHHITQRGNNPVRAGLVGKAAQYPWSSAAAHLDGADAVGLIDGWRRQRGLAEDWEAGLRVEVTGGGDAALRRATCSGLPFGDAEFGWKRVAAENCVRILPDPSRRRDLASRGSSAS